MISPDFEKLYLTNDYEIIKRVLHSDGCILMVPRLQDLLPPQVRHFEEKLD